MYFAVVVYLVGMVACNVLFVYISFVADPGALPKTELASHSLVTGFYQVNGPYNPILRELKYC